ncbi:dUTP pyrophosphatase [Aneurinibacillus soli]|uniref:Deoxyuridine 5'-triphosphate nucleotidohydrolase n=1 Tax=Aneurinibacillus soli TaxID=1500254 RepID=A0A0U4WG77_9BACL|nr:dUTP diphosphatase [Aneurinibacillus soli]PYE63346.1 dUTP pyrophosphatase [Aneurinibacillus soli]BAU27723.1 Deoxyuridine 5'-triphosphate nucleotidohydrolase [Aneurinibacillus soli]
MTDVTVHINVLPGNEDIGIPRKMTDLASGFDLCAAVRETVTLAPGERGLIPAGFALAMPATLEAQVRPRSGLAYKKGVTTLNSPGTIDADYRGEVGVILINHGQEPFVIERGDRIAQMVFQWVPHVALVEVDNLDDTERGSGGFGHTGV